jgi:hypothetical protein
MFTIIYIIYIYTVYMLKIHHHEIPAMPYISMPSGDAREQFEPGNMLHHRAGLHLRGSIRRG